MTLAAWSPGAFPLADEGDHFQVAISRARSVAYWLIEILSSRLSSYESQLLMSANSSAWEEKGAIRGGLQSIARQLSDTAHHTMLRTPTLATLRTLSATGAAPAACSCGRGASAAYHSSASALFPSTLSSPTVIADASSATKTKNSPKGHARKVQQHADGRLRKCIELYHLTSSFFPTQLSRPETFSGLASQQQQQQPQHQRRPSEPTIDVQQTPSLKPRSLEEEIDFLVMDELATSTRMTGRSTTGSSSGSKSSMLKSPRFLTAGELVSQANSSERNTRYSESTGSFAFDSFSPPATHRALGTASAEAGGEQSKAALLDDFTQDRLRRERFRHRSSAEKKPVLGKSRMLDDASDRREALLRDALFGTVGFELPGLEIVRERVAEKKRREGSQS